VARPESLPIRTVTHPGDGQNSALAADARLRQSLGVLQPVQRNAPGVARMNRSPYRPLQIATGGFLALVVLAMAVSAALTWREQSRLELARYQLQRIHIFEQAYFEIQGTLAQGLSEEWVGTGDRWAGLQRGVRQLIQLGGTLDAETPARLHAILALLARPIADPEGALLAAKKGVREISRAESEAQNRLLASIQADAAAQLRLEILVPSALIAFGVAVVFVLRRQIFAPLSALQQLLARLATGNFARVPEEDIPPAVASVYKNFNTLAERLAVLEAAHREREENLEHAVRSAAGTLLDQQRSLARAERLAATGELAAGFAHEVRNPLAGIQLSLANLKNELESPEYRDRIDGVLEEVERLSQLLRDMLDTSRHQPETARDVDLHPLVDDLLGITRYQLPALVRLENRIAPGARCFAPEGAVRQMLLNVILNSSAALGSQGGLIEISSEATTAEGMTTIQIADDGPGFPQELLDSGIRPFFSTREGGTGLGLTLVQRLVRDAGGRIALRNRRPCGAETTLLLPSTASHG
jgi:signal transduction histidine kinase